MGDIAPNFDRSEFACRCGCGFDTVDVELATVAQTLRDRFGPLILTERGGACRCPAYNEEVGGSKQSQHLYARAMDFYCPNADAREVQDFIDRTWPDTYGLGRYKGWTHVDTRRQKARWSG